MVINILFNQWIVVKNRDPLLYTASNNRDIAIRKFESREKRKPGGRGEKIINADISVKDLNLED